MSSKLPMSTSLRPATAQPEPQGSLGTDGTALSGLPLFERSPIRESREAAAALDAESRAAIVDAAMQAAVDSGWAKRSDFAEDLGEDTSQVSLELNRAKDKRLKVQTWDSAYVVALAERPAALLQFIQRLGAPFGIQSVMVDRSDPDFVRRELAKELPEKRRRQWEREHGLPEGWLDR